MLKIKKLGIEWGAAHEEASPHRITTNEAECIIYESEKGDLIIQTSSAMQITQIPNGIEITLV